MPRLALLVAVLNLMGYLIAMRFIPWMGLSHPRGGVFSFAAYLALALLMIRVPNHIESDATERIGARWGGWIMLFMPPLWWVISANA
ncbi:hypothetical protein [Archangium lansingense]|uniref:Uncharacterized protein n=1 Tax=Archangium lansingense TaxID=2995310 RepID=A0ABT4A3H3_9BACT|nr:hypothetical protein [Archangium lansinium]MCY1075534.1 hypothetical protein [Archangium lansinium]